jgi:transcriptional regulator with XRE-family HTH domain
MTVLDYAIRMLDCGKVRKIREALGLTQVEAANLAGLKSGRQQWNDIESGRRANIQLDTLGRIAAALKVDPAELLKPARRGKK